MKRSEMRDALIDVIEGEYSWDGPKCRISFEYAYYIAENVLNKIEEKGMIPPLNEQNYHHMDGDARVHDNITKNFYRTWEKE